MLSLPSLTSSSLDENGVPLILVSSSALSSIPHYHAPHERMRQHNFLGGGGARVVSMVLPKFLICVYLFIYLFIFLNIC